MNLQLDGCTEGLMVRVKANHYPGYAFGIVSYHGLIRSDCGGYSNVESEI